MRQTMKNQWNIMKNRDKEERNNEKQWNIEKEKKTPWKQWTKEKKNEKRNEKQ